MALIEFSEFSYAYPNSTPALENISLKISGGEFITITGPSGAGKTTLALSVTGIVPHYYGGSQSGTVTVNGINTAQSSMSELAKFTGIIMADYESQLVAMTVAEEVGFSLETSGLSKEEMFLRIRETLARVGLKGKEKSLVSDLSGGQKQRLAIASVLAVMPDILVLDEPTSALDPEGAEDIYQLLAALNKKEGKTIIVVEHNLTLALPYTGQIVLLDKAKIAKTGSPQEVLRHMWEDETLRAGIPPLWEIKLLSEELTGFNFGNWLSKEHALAELAVLRANK